MSRPGGIRILRQALNPVASKPPRTSSSHVPRGEGTVRALVLTKEHSPNNAISCWGSQPRTVVPVLYYYARSQSRGTSCPPARCFQLGGICRRHRVGVLVSGWGLQGLSPSSVATQVQWASGSGAGSDKASRLALYHLKTLSRVNPCCRREALTSADLAPPVSAPSWRLTGGWIHIHAREGDNLGEPNARTECYVFAGLTECGGVGFAQRRKSECCVMILWSKCKTSRPQHILALLDSGAHGNRQCVKNRQLQHPSGSGLGHDEHLRGGSHPQTVAVPDTVDPVQLTWTGSAVGKDEPQSGCRVGVPCGSLQFAAGRLPQLPEAA